MARPVDISDEAIVDITRELFLEKGIAGTQMKDIALRAGIGRSSLYRHFESKETIAFEIATRILEKITEQLEAFEPSGQTGAQALRQMLERYVQLLLEHPRWVCFLDEFDQFFSDAYPDSRAAAEYILFNSRLSNAKVEAALERGAADGSLRLCGTVRFTQRFLLNALLGMAQRILPRAEHYQQEHGCSVEYLLQLPEVLVAGISEK